MESGSLFAAATVVTEAWLGMVRTQASTLSSDEHVVRETVALAAALIDSGRPQIPSA
jgi:hypothetical protein